MRRWQTVWMLVLAFICGYSTHELLLRIESGNAGVHTATDLVRWIMPGGTAVLVILEAWRATARGVPPKPGD